MTTKTTTKPATKTTTKPAAKAGKPTTKRSAVDKAREELKEMRADAVSLLAKIDEAIKESDQDDLCALLVDIQNEAEGIGSWAEAEASNLEE
jgi:hypothetical protein